MVVTEVIQEVPVYKGHSYYLIPHSGYAHITFADISGFSKQDLRLARNEIYARHGYVFKSKDLQRYFNSQGWYVPDPSFDGTLSAVEKANVKFIQSYE